MTHLENIWKGTSPANRRGIYSGNLLVLHKELFDPNLEPNVLVRVSANFLYNNPRLLQDYGFSLNPQDALEVEEYSAPETGRVEGLPYRKYVFKCPWDSPLFLAPEYYPRHQKGRLIYTTNPEQWSRGYLYRLGSAVLHNYMILLGLE